MRATALTRSASEALPKPGGLTTSPPLRKGGQGGSGEDVMWLSSQVYPV